MTRCPAQYQRPGGHEPGDRIVECHLVDCHAGDHEEAGAGFAWTDPMPTPLDPLADLTAILKRRYDTGEYGNAHFKLPRPVYDEMRQHVPTPEPGTYPRGLLGGYSLGDLMGIPILIDDEMPENTWRLIRTTTDEVIRAGRVTLAAEEDATGSAP